MKKFLIILVVLCCSLSLSAQDYKTHKVQQGETIEEIAKQYLVTPFDIFALNPDAKDGIKPNMVLIIPASRIKNQTIQEETKELIGKKTHKVRRKETLFSIAQKYKIEVDDIKKYNPRLY
ncbi:MAG: LysM peptidoglycan-binding domain-containing protein, partial [Psychroserpens sp.]|nr:LysM peptidoglycan-binding domain-containing protein [Psychroserpens sp.]